jgi:thiaminase
MEITCQKLVEKHSTVWIEATRHQFLDYCKTGTIAPAQFATWLVQDYLFVTEFTRLAARLLAAAPVAHFDVILGGLVSLKEELKWFHAKASERQLTLDVPRQEACQRYCQFMEQLSVQPYAVQATGFWAIEAVYNQAWQRLVPLAEPYAEFANRWGNPEFTAYVSLLKGQADEALRRASATERDRAEEVFLKALELEKSFWQMAFEGISR